MFNFQGKDISMWHFWVSHIKSSIRIVAGICLISGSLGWAGAALILAEVFGIIEELK